MAQIDLHEKIKKWRVFSTSAFIFAAILLYDVIHWVMDKSVPNELGDGVVVTGIVTALVGLIKFTFEFAVSDSSKEKKEQ